MHVHISLRSLLYTVAWFGLAWLPVVCEKCCFPLAEARKKRKTFFSHTSGGLGASVRGVEVTWLMRFPTFLVAVRHCLTSRPLTLLVFWTFFPWKIVFSISCLLCGFLIVSILLVTAVFILFSGLVCLSCYNPLFQDNCSFIDLVCG